MMIRVVIEGPAVSGRFYYRIETPGTRLAVPLTGLSHDPLLDACRRLKEGNAANEDALIGLYDDLKNKDVWSLRTTVGYGAKYMLYDPPGGGGPRFVPFKEDARFSSRGTAQDALNGEDPTSVTPAISEAPPLSPQTPPELPAGTGPAVPEPAKPVLQPRKRKPIRSGGRRGRR